MLAVVVTLLVVGAASTQAAEQKLGFSVNVEGEGFFLNPVVTKIVVDEVVKGSLAEAAGIRKGDQIVKIDGEDVVGKRALGLQKFMTLGLGETRTFRIKHADGTEADARITKPKS
jgi:C-terminal processing protease CtpA/Prc